MSTILLVKNTRATFDVLEKGEFDYTIDDDTLDQVEIEFDIESEADRAYVVLSSKGLLAPNRR